MNYLAKATELIQDAYYDERGMADVMRKDAAVYATLAQVEATREQTEQLKKQNDHLKRIADALTVTGLDEGRGIADVLDDIHSIQCGL